MHLLNTGMAALTLGLFVWFEQKELEFEWRTVVCHEEQLCVYVLFHSDRQGPWCFFGLVRILSVACFSEDLKCWGAWDTTCGRKAKDVTSPIAWKEEALDDWSSLKGRERAIVNQTNTGWNPFKANVGDTSERRGGAHMGFSERIDTILNWT